MVESIKDSDVEEAAEMPSINEAMQHLLAIAGVEPDGVYHDDLWSTYDAYQRTRELLVWLKQDVPA